MGFGYSPSYVRHFLSAVSFAFDALDLPNPIPLCRSIRLHLRAADVLHRPRRAPAIPLPVLLSFLDWCAANDAGPYADAVVFAVTFLLRGCELFCRAAETDAPPTMLSAARLARCGAPGDERSCHVLRTGMLSFHDDFGIARPPATAAYVTVDFGALDRSKGDRRGLAGTRTYKRSGDRLCAVSAAARLVAWTASLPAPVRAFQPLASSWGTPHMSVTRLLTVLNDVGRAHGCAEQFTMHSFRATGATYLAGRGCTGAQLKHWGRWASDAYEIYIRASPIEAAAISAAFAFPPGFSAPFLTADALSPAIAMPPRVHARPAGPQPPPACRRV